VLCVGRMAAEKRQDVVLEAVARCQHREQIRLIVGGFGPKLEELEALAKKLQLPAEIGYLSHDALDEAFASADVFVHAGEVELEGMSVLEAMASGLPVLIADAPESAASLVAPGPDFLFRAGDPGDLAAKLDRLLDSPSMRDDASRASLNYASHHRLAESTMQLEHLYESLLPQRRFTQKLHPMQYLPGAM
jgi:1,2-diacylglycerol 3-alpha-glucosyltransferase